MKNLEIISFKGIEPHYFGDTFETVQKKASKNSQLIDNKKGKRIIDGIYSLGFKNNKLNEISLFSSDKVFFS